MKKIITIALLCGMFNFAFSQNLGIDQPNPTEKLDVNGNARIRGNVIADGAVKAVNTPKAWVNFDGSTLVIRDSYGVASVTRSPNNPTGVFRITFTTPFANTGYVVAGACNALNFGGGIFTIEDDNSANTDMTTTKIDCGCRTGTNGYSNTNIVTLVVYGNQ